MVFSNNEKVECARVSWVLITMLDAIAQMRVPATKTQASKVKFNSRLILIRCIEEAFENMTVKDGQSLEIINEYIEWMDYQNIVRVISRNGPNHSKKQHLVNRAIEVFIFSSVIDMNFNARCIPLYAVTYYAFVPMLQILSPFGTLGDNIEYVIKSVVEGAGVSSPDPVVDE